MKWAFDKHYQKLLKLISCLVIATSSRTIAVHQALVNILTQNTSHFSHNWAIHLKHYQQFYGENAISPGSITVHQTLLFYRPQAS